MPTVRERRLCILFHESEILGAGLSVVRALGALRLSLGWPSTEADVDLALKAVPEAVARLRSA